MDALSDVLRVVGLTGGVFLDARFTAPWCVLGKVGPDECRPFMAPPPLVMCFHYVTEGECEFQIGDEEPCLATAGDAVLIPHNQFHKFGSDLRLDATPAGDIIQVSTGSGLARIDHGGGGAPCSMTCGFLGADRQLSTVIGALPQLLKVSMRDTVGGEWISQSFTHAARELAQGRPGAATVVSKMAELLFVEAVRRYLTSLPDTHTGLLAGLRDPAVGKALALMHTKIQYPWTADELAEQVNLSRSAFADRFAELMGLPPMKYLTNWRMQISAQKLREGGLPIGQIAFEAGYDSEASFTRAFKREMGVPPATWRKRDRHAG